MQTEFRTILWRRGLSMMLFVLFSVTVATAQLLVRGTVIDQTGETVIGASIQLKGTTQGTITDIDGKFSLGVPDKKLSLSFLLSAMPPRNFRWIPPNRCPSYWKKTRRCWMKSWW